MFYCRTLRVCVFSYFSYFLIDCYDGYRNLPFGLAPGIGLSAYLAYGLILNEDLSVPQAFTSVRIFLF
jgi:xanthine/uracil/vitamin C permease (AzgA family)